MTNLYCPKGHDQLDRIFKGGAGINSIYHCYGCSRRYLDIDCVADLQNNQPDCRFSETVDIQKKMSTESQKCEHNFEWQQLKFTGIGINPNMPVLTCSKCGQVRNNLPPSTTGTLFLVELSGQDEYMHVQAKVEGDHPMTSGFRRYLKEHFLSSNSVKKAALSLFLATMVSICLAAPAVNQGRDVGETFFAGSVMQCTAATPGKNSECCIASEGKSGDVMSQCTADERTLAWLAKQHDLTVYLGQACIQGAKACQSPVAVYCAFSDTVTYKVQTEGRQQLGINFGTAASPDCGGLTAEQMQKINLNKITFGDQPYQSVM